MTPGTASQDRLRGLVEANLAIVSDLDLSPLGGARLVWSVPLAR